VYLDVSAETSFEDIPDVVPPNWRTNAPTKLFAGGKFAGSLRVSYSIRLAGAVNATRISSQSFPRLLSPGLLRQDVNPANARANLPQSGPVFFPKFFPAVRFRRRSISRWALFLVKLKFQNFRVLSWSSSLSLFLDAHDELVRSMRTANKIDRKLILRRPRDRRKRRTRRRNGEREEETESGGQVRPYCWPS